MPSQPDRASRVSPEVAAFEAPVLAAVGARSTARHPWVVWLLSSAVVGSVFAWLAVPATNPGNDAGRQYSGIVRIEPGVRGRASVPRISEAGAQRETAEAAPATALVAAGASVGSDGASRASADGVPATDLPVAGRPANDIAGPPPSARAPAADESVLPPRARTASGTVAAEPEDAVSTAPRSQTTRNRVTRADPQSVATVQRRLAALGYAVGPIDGEMGPRTRAAIVAWQRGQGLVPDGRLPDALLNFPLGDNVVIPAPADRTGDDDEAADRAGQPGAAATLPLSQPIPQRIDPALQGFEPYEQAAIERWCARGRLASDRLGFLRCVVEQRSQFPNGSGIPDLSLRPGAQRQRLLAMTRDACGEPGETEPQRYFVCMADLVSRNDARERGTPGRITPAAGERRR